MNYLQIKISNTLRIVLLCGVSLTATESSWAGKGVWNDAVAELKDITTPSLQKLKGICQNKVKETDKQAEKNEKWNRRLKNVQNIQRLSDISLEQAKKLLADRKQKEVIFDKMSPTHSEIISVPSLNKDKLEETVKIATFNLTAAIEETSEILLNLELAKVRNTEISPVREKLYFLQEAAKLNRSFESEEEALKSVSKIEMPTIFSLTKNMTKSEVETKTQPFNIEKAIQETEGFLSISGLDLRPIRKRLEALKNAQQMGIDFESEEQAIEIGMVVDVTPTSSLPKSKPIFDVNKAILETMELLENLAYMKDVDLKPIQEKLERLKKAQMADLPFNSEEEALLYISVGQEKQKTSKPKSSEKKEDSFHMEGIDDEIISRISELDLQINNLRKADVPENEIKSLKDEMDLLLKSINQ